VETSGAPFLDSFCERRGFSAAAGAKHAWRVEQVLPIGIDQSRFALIYRANPLKWRSRALAMPTTTKKFTPEIDAKLYKEFVATAKRNGQSQRHVLEAALKFYLKNVVPSQHLVRPEVMNDFEQSVARNRDLLDRLAK
jgi:hypothetical protein